MGFQTGLSGLNTASKNLDVIGHNVANSGTVGFKASQAQFSDVFAASLSGGGASQIGIGAKLSNVAQQFTQGNITVTNNPLDMAINGGGFFQLSQNGATTYTRNGQFQLDKDNFIVASGGQRLQGFQVDPNNTVTGAMGDLEISTATINPQRTGRGSLEAGTGVKIGLNLDSRSTVPSSATFSPTDVGSYNKSTPVQVYDSLGNAHTLSLYFGATSTPGVWDINATVDGKPASTSTLAAVTDANLKTATKLDDVVTAAGLADTTSPALLTTQIAAAAAAKATAAAAVAAAAATPPTGTTSAAASAVQAMAKASRILADAVAANYPTDTVNGPAADTAAKLAQTEANAAFTKVILSATQLSFDNSGKLLTDMPLNIDIDLTAIGLAQDPVVTNNAAQHLKFNLDFTGSTQFGSAFGVNSLSQDGYAPGELAGFGIGSDGILQGRYTNGQTKTLGQVSLANFANPQGLQQLGDNQWAVSPDSGVALVGVPGASGMGLLQSSSTEDSNVDLTAELVNMIVAQRAYQANAQTIKTQDAIQQTLINLR